MYYSRQAERVFDNQTLKDALGAATANFLAHTLRNGDTIGISWGTTMAQVGSHLGRYSTSHVRVVQMNGAMGDGPQLTNAYALLEQFGKAFHAEVYGLNAPGIVDNVSICQAICQDSRVGRASRLLAKLMLPSIPSGCWEHSRCSSKRGMLGRR